MTSSSKTGRIIILGSVLLCMIIGMMAWKVHFNRKEGFEGLFVLKGTGHYWYELTDDLFPEESERLIWKVPGHLTNLAVPAERCKNGSCLTYQWDPEAGRGFIKNNFADGRKLLICLSRFGGYQGRPNQGIFVGGNLPADDPDFQLFNKNETGMAYYDGKRYFHIWCNVNEIISTFERPDQPLYPTMWEFVDSQVLAGSRNGVTIRSRHRAIINGVPVAIEKYLRYNTGDTFFTLVTKLSNVGTQPVSFVYEYGDEPWLGNYGSSNGNIGWVKDRFVLTESFIDPKVNSFAGMFDYGNELAGEGHDKYTWKSNFIQWTQSARPDLVFYSNQSTLPSSSGVTPLNSPDNRFIGLEWGLRSLPPGSSLSIPLAIGMADSDPKTGFPVLQNTRLN
jgi:hypothetical protein